MTDLIDLGVGEAAAAIRSGRLSSRDHVAACLARIAATDADLLAWVTIDSEGALAMAQDRDADMAAGRPIGPLHGVALGVKDIVDVAGLPTRAGAAAFAHRLPTRDATLVARLRAAGAVILGKTVTTQFAFKDPAVTRNPWSADRTPGGSSSGSAAAVAARQVPAAIGTQTVGSILRPAAYCGIVGLKGALGSVALDGVVPLATSFDVAGPLARTVADTALLQGIMTGVDVVADPIDRPRFVVCPELLERAEPGLLAHLESVIDRLRAAGAVIDEVDWPGSFDGIISAGLVILAADAAASHAMAFAAHGTDYAPGIAALVRTGQTRTTTEVAGAQRELAAFGAAMAQVLATHDALLSPVAPGPAPLRETGTGDFTLCGPWSFIGVPAIAIPTGLDPAGLPLAVQLVGGVDAMGRLIGAAAWAEQVIAFDAKPAAA